MWKSRLKEISVPVIYFILYSCAILMATFTPLTDEFYSYDKQIILDNPYINTVMMMTVTFNREFTDVEKEVFFR